MTFVSYAQNFEDIALWRALHWFTPGFYIDVGANDPTHDSVTRAFYERGWRGVNVEPVENYYRALCRERPEDVNLQLIVGDAEGEVAFREYRDTGLSTATPDPNADWGFQLGLQPIEREAQMRTLSSICEQYATGDIHFLKIDVEGFEAQVLRGFDLRRWRPWIIVIETPFGQNPEWKSVIPDAGYRKVRFDSLNTFYLAEERLNLAGAFEIPPCSMDEFQLRRGHPMCYPIDQLERQIEALSQRAADAERRVQEVTGTRWFRLGQRLVPLRRLFSR